MKTLLRLGADVERKMHTMTPLDMAMSLKRGAVGDPLAVAKVLLSHGASVRVEHHHRISSLFPFPSPHDWIGLRSFQQRFAAVGNTAPLLITDYERQEADMHAAASVRLLGDFGTDFDHSDEICGSSLHLAAKACGPMAIQALISEGAGLRHVMWGSVIVDKSRATALHLAAAYATEESVLAIASTDEPTTKPRGRKSAGPASTPAGINDTRTKAKPTLLSSKKPTVSDIRKSSSSRNSKSGLSQMPSSLAAAADDNGRTPAHYAAATRAGRRRSCRSELTLGFRIMAGVPFCTRRLNTCKSLSFRLFWQNKRAAMTSAGVESICGQGIARG